MQYVVIPASPVPVFQLEEVLWCRSYNEAIDDAEQQANETGQPYAVLEVAYTTKERTPLPRHEQYGVTPGVDFPGTLGPERG